LVVFQLFIANKEQAMPVSNQTYARVARVLVLALGVEEDDLKPSATLQGDLGAESTDFLDLTFRLEREFGIKIPRGELFPDLAAPGDPAFTRDGGLTEAGLAALRSHMPYADLSDLENDPRQIRINDLFTVDLLTNYIEWKLHRSRTAAADADEPILAAAGLTPQ
jgi:acyl carrier protein